MRSKQEKLDAILWCLRREPEGMYGLDLCKITGLWGGSIYIYLARLEDDGLVTSTIELRSHPKLARRRYRILEGRA